MDFKKTTYWSICADTVGLLRDNLEAVQIGTADWGQICTTASVMSEKYQDLPEKGFAFTLLHAVIDELGRIENRR